MSVIKTWVGWFCAAFLPVYFGGDSSSDSSVKSTTNTTTNVSSEDKRIVGGDGSTGVSGSGNTVVVTDNGAVQAALNMSGAVVTKALDNGQANVNSVLSELHAMAQDNQTTFDKTLTLVGTAVDKTQDAFKVATEEVNGNRVLVAVGVIAMGLMFAKGAVK
ncbi:hypothetical protein [Herbaspirillum huttiense]|uniref:hypothetical protein n=1 Tax=Herbaspirillum huttiense TaxID=863372 RepID=UPI003F3ADDF3